MYCRTNSHHNSLDHWIEPQHRSSVFLPHHPDQDSGISGTYFTNRQQAQFNEMPSRNLHEHTVSFCSNHSYVSLPQSTNYTSHRHIPSFSSQSSSSCCSSPRLIIDESASSSDDEDDSSLSFQTTSQLEKISTVIQEISKDLKSRQSTISFEQLVDETLRQNHQLKLEVSRLEDELKERDDRLELLTKKSADNQKLWNKSLQTACAQNKVLERTSREMKLRQDEVLSENSQQAQRISKVVGHLQIRNKQLEEMTAECNRHKRKREAALQVIEDQKETIAHLEKQAAVTTSGKGSWPGLEIRQSTIPKAGEGLFTKLPIPQGVVIGEYYGETVFRIKTDDGHYVMWRQGKQGPEYINDDSYVVWISENFMNDGVWTQARKEKGIDGARKGSHIEATALRKMNHSKKNNIFHFICDDGSVRCYTTRPIAAGEELFWDYDEEVEPNFEADLKAHIVRSPEKYCCILNDDVVLREPR